jgi:hypothetical protein
VERFHGHGLSRDGTPQRGRSRLAARPISGHLAVEAVPHGEKYPAIRRTRADELHSFENVGGPLNCRAKAYREVLHRGG